MSKDIEIFGLKHFLTAYDPNDLPSGSIDPLGFERGYLSLADQILPGMTNVASCPRYFGLVCAGVRITDLSNIHTRADKINARKKTILLLEKVWALANTLIEDEVYSLSVLRGVQSARVYRSRLSSAGNKYTDLAGLDLLSNQTAYGAIGVYAAVAEYNGLFKNRSEYELAEVGERLADAFIKETQFPQELLDFIGQKSHRVSLDTLSSWGRRAYLWNSPYGHAEEKAIRDMFYDNPKYSNRTVFINTIIDLYEMGKFDPENDDLDQLLIARLMTVAKKNGHYRHFEVCRIILDYEKIYKYSLLAFQLLLYRSERLGGIFPISTLTQDEEWRGVRQGFTVAANEFFENCNKTLNRDILSYHNDIIQFVEILSGTQNEVQFAEAILDRHNQVQQGKLDHGKPKAPWVSLDGDDIKLILSQNMASNKAPTIESISPHHYRLNAANNWMKAAGLYRAG